MPAPKMPDKPAAVSAAAAAEALDASFGDRPGWSSTDRGWTHQKTGLHVEARNSCQPFLVTRKGAAGEITLGTRAALDLHLAHAGA